MDRTEISHLVGAIIILTIVISFENLILGKISSLGTFLLFAIILVTVNIVGKKLMANMLDLDVEHKMWAWSQWGWKKHQHFQKPMPAGIIIPLIITVLTRGVVSMLAVLTYEAKAKTIRASKRFGYYSYNDLTEWHNALIGAGGVVFTLAFSAIAYFLPTQLEQLAALSAGYAFWNMLPISNLDGSQIFFGSRVLYAALAIITIIFAFYSASFWLI